MTVSTAPIKAAKPPAISEQRVVLHNVSWETYERLLDELGDSRGTRLAYDEGTLEIMSPYIRHEHTNRFLDKLVFALCEELNIELLSAGALTCKRADLKKGFEPDSCFYIANERSMRGKKDVNLKRDPPPDLAIEVDISRSSMNKFKIYVALGIPEVWIWDGQKLQIHLLRDKNYVTSSESLSFPGIPIAGQCPKLLADAAKLGELAAIREFRTWLRKQRRMK